MSTALTDYINYQLTPEDERRRRDTIVSAMRLGGVKMPMDVAKSILSADIEMTMEGASTIIVQLNDPDRVILRSKYLTDGTRMQIPRSDGVVGKWDTFALVKISKNGDNLTLTFEDEAIWRLRKYNSKLKVNRNQMTRAQFALKLCQEPKPRIPLYSPELLIKQPIGTSKSYTNYQASQVDTTGQGTAKTSIDASGLKIKGKAATDEQLDNIAEVLAVGVKLKAPKATLYASIVTVIQESSALNLPGGDRDSVGMFQQRPSQGWTGLRNIPKAARQFFLGPSESGPNGAIEYYVAHPGATSGGIAQAVQRSAYPDAYAKWDSEARSIVSAYLGSGSTGYRGSLDRVDKQKYASYEFTRGDPDDPSKKEDSWTCLQRLADEVGWVCFAYRGTVYFISEEELYSRAPKFKIAEFGPGVDTIDFDYDAGGKVAQLNVSVYAERWFGAPGTTVQAVGIGPASGRWLISDFSRSLFDDLATVTCKKANPKLPEPAPKVKSQDINLDTGEPLSGQGDVNNVLTSTRKGESKPLDGSYPAPGFHGAARNAFGTTEAADIMVPVGTPVLAVLPGTIGSSIGPLGSSDTRLAGERLHLFTSGNEFYYAHLSRIDVRAGQKVAAGQQLGLSGMANGVAHLHFEVKNGKIGDFV